MEPDNVVLKTNSYFQGQHGTWQCFPGNLFIFPGPEWNLTMWSWKHISIFRACLEPDNMVLITYLYFQGLHGTWQCGNGNIFLFSGPAWNLRMWSWKPIHICRAIMEPDNVVLETNSYFQGHLGTWQCGPKSLFLFSGPAWILKMWS